MPASQQSFAPLRSLPRKHLAFLLSGAVFILLTLFLWLPFGFKTIGLVEEWGIIGRYTSGENMLFFTPETNPQLGSRPITLAPFVIGHLLTPNSFLGINLLQMLAIAARGTLAYLLLRRLAPFHPFLAFAAALLFMLYPADQGTMTIRSMAIHLHVAFGLAAILLLVIYWDSPHRWLWFGIWLAQLLTLGLYELMYPLFFLTPILLLRRGNFTKRRWLTVSLVWLIVPGLLFVRVVVLLMQGYGYTAQLLEKGLQTSGSLPLDILSSILRMYQVHIIPWLNAGVLIETNPSSITLALVAGALAGCVGWWHLRRNQRLPLAFAAGLIGIGLLVMLLGFASYLPTAQRNANWRAFFASSMGAALVMTAVITLIGSRWRVIGAALLGIFITIAVLILIAQHRTYVNLSFQLEDLFASVLRQAPEVTPDSVIIIYDELRVYSHPWLLAGSSTRLGYAMSYFYRQPIEAAFCYSNPLNGEACVFDETGLIHTIGTTITNHYRYDQLILFRTSYTGQLELLETLPASVAPAATGAAYAPQQRIDHSAPIPERALETLVCPIDLSCAPPLWETTPQDEIQLEFDRLVRGTGWEGLRADTELTRPEYQWMIATEATIWLPLKREHDMHIQFRVSYALAPDILESLALQVNGNEMVLSTHLDSVGATIFEGSIPRTVLTEDWNEFRFMINRTENPATLGLSADNRDLGLLFDWLQVNPADQAGA